MDITMPPDLVEIVADMVRRGIYPDPLTVIRAALYRLNNEEDELDWDREDLRREIMIGIESLERGERIPFNEAEVEKILA